MSRVEQIEALINTAEAVANLGEAWVTRPVTHPDHTDEFILEVIERMIDIEDGSGAWPSDLTAKHYFHSLNSYFVPTAIYRGSMSVKFTFNMEETWEEEQGCNKCFSTGKVADKICSKCSGKGSISYTKKHSYQQEVLGTGSLTISKGSVSEVKILGVRNPSATLAGEYLGDAPVVLRGELGSINVESSASIYRRMMMDEARKNAKAQLKGSDKVVKEVKNEVGDLKENAEYCLTEVMLGVLDYNGEKLAIEVPKTGILEVKMDYPKTLKKGVMKFWGQFFAWHIPATFIIMYLLEVK